MYSRRIYTSIRARSQRVLGALYYVTTSISSVSYTARRVLKFSTLRAIFDHENLRASCRRAAREALNAAKSKMKNRTQFAARKFQAIRMLTVLSKQAGFVSWSGDSVRVERAWNKTCSINISLPRQWERKLAMTVHVWFIQRHTVVIYFTRRRWSVQDHKYIEKSEFLWIYRLLDDKLAGWKSFEMFALISSTCIFQKNCCALRRLLNSI